MRFFMYAVIFLTVLILQVIFSTYFRISGIAPNILLVFVISNSLLKDHKHGFFMGLIVGLTLDILTRRALGFNALLFMHIGLLTGLLSNRIYNNSLFPIIFIVVLSTFFYNLATYFVFFYHRNGIFIWDIFSSQIGTEMLYNVIVILMMHKMVICADAFLNEKKNIY